MVFGENLNITREEVLQPVGNDVQAAKTSSTDARRQRHAGLSEECAQSVARRE